MARHVEAYMDGRALSALGPYVIREVYEDPPTIEILNGERPGGYGQRIMMKKRQSLKVAIEVLIREIFDLSARSRHAEKFAEWCQGNVLELSNHPERRLQVYCSAEPALGAARDYNSALRAEFTADTVPYWEDRVPTQLTASGDSGSGTIWVPGTAETPVNISVTPTGATLTSFQVTVGGQSVTLSSLSVAQNANLKFERDARDSLAITCGGTSQLSKRTAASADDLFVKPGSVSYSYTASTACTVVLSARGRWS